MSEVAPNVLIVAASHSAKSRSRKLARIAAAKLASLGVSCTQLDLHEETNALPFAGSSTGWGHPNVTRLSAMTAAATHLIFAVPIYNYDVNAAAKNFVELMGKDALTGKTVGFLCSAGGKGSYMSILGLANSLMLDFRCWIVPRFVYMSEEFDDEVTPEIDRRIDGLLKDLLSR